MPIAPDDNQVAEFVCCAAVSEQTHSLAEIFEKRPSEILQASSWNTFPPGLGMLDTACTKFLLGVNTLKEFEKILSRKFGFQVVRFSGEVAKFRFGNGEILESSSMVHIPVCFGGRVGFITACIIPGSTPLLLSLPLMAELHAMCDLMNFRLSSDLSLCSVDWELVGGHVTIPLHNFPSGSRAGEFFNPDLRILAQTNEFRLYDSDAARSHGDQALSVAPVAIASEHARGDLQHEEEGRRRDEGQRPDGHRKLVGRQVGGGAARADGDERAGHPSPDRERTTELYGSDGDVRCTDHGPDAAGSTPGCRPRRTRGRRNELRYTTR